jgi:F-type H+-transporting ATPase subunit epsilon
LGEGLVKQAPSPRPSPRVRERENTLSPALSPKGEREKVSKMLHFELVTPEKLVRSEDVYMVVVPGSEGDFGVLEGHAPLMSTIRDGALHIYKSDKAEPEMLAIAGGFAEVNARGLTVLAERIG